MARIVLLPDPKRSDQRRRLRKIRHLAALAPLICNLHEAPGIFVWDDLSLLWFTRPMRRRTIFVFHHHDPQQYDSMPIEPLLWQALFSALRECWTVVCVSPHWAKRLAVHGIDARLIYNAFDLEVVDSVRAEDRALLRQRFALPVDRVVVYVGKAVHGKGVELAEALLAPHPEFCLVSSGNNTIGARTLHKGWLSPRDHLRLVHACDVGLFLSSLQEGWSRCAAEAVLLGLPCLTSGVAGLGDLSRLAGQPVADPTRLAEQLRARTPTPADGEGRDRIARFDVTYFTEEWRRLVRSALEAVVAEGDPGWQSRVAGRL
jgi:glycosyltransferase involved in cell wall biosynthesis